MAVQPLASQVGVAPACRDLGVHGLLRRRQRPARAPRAAPSYARPALVRPNARTSSTCSPARDFVDRSPAEVARRCSMKASICAPSARCTGSWPRTSRCESGQSAQSSLLQQARLVATGPSPDLVLISPGSGGPNAGRPSTSMSCSTSSAAASWAGWLPIGKRRARRDADRGNLCIKQGIGPRCSPCIRRRADDQQVHRRHLLADLGVNRSLSRPQVSDDNPFSEAQFKTLKGPPRLPWALRRHYRRHRLLPVFEPWYNIWSTAMPGSRCSPPMMSIITGSTGCARGWLSAGVPCKPPGPFTPKRFVHAAPSETRPASRPRLDQPTTATSTFRRNESVNRNRRCLKALTGSAPALGLLHEIFVLNFLITARYRTYGRRVLPVPIRARHNAQRDRLLLPQWNRPGRLRDAQSGASTTRHRPSLIIWTVRAPGTRPCSQGR